PPRLRAEEVNPFADPELEGSVLERLAVRPLTCDHQLDPVRCRDGLEGAAERLLRGEAPGERERGAVQPEGAAEIFARRQTRNVGRGVRQNADAISRDSPRKRELAEVCAGREDMCSTTQLEVARLAQQRNHCTAPAALKVVHIARDKAA